MAWRHGKDSLEKFVEHFNTHHPNIRFTWDYTSNNGTPVSFMDLSVIIRENRLIHELYRKPSDSGVNLNFDSQIPNGVKMAVATEQFRRANELSSSPNACKRSLDEIKMLLADNSVPEYAIEDALHRCEGLEKGRHRKKDSEKVTLKLPFLSDKLNQRLRSIVRQSKLPRKKGSLARPDSNLRHQFA